MPQGAAGEGRVSKKARKVYACDQCPFTATKSYNYKNHIRIHSGDRCVSESSGVAIQYDDLSFDLFNLTTVYIHPLTHRPYKCPQCDYAAAQLTTLKSHVRSHTGERPYKCPSCDYTAVQPYALRVHQRKHTGEKYGMVWYENPKVYFNMLTSLQPT